MTTKSLIKSSLLKNQKIGVIGAGISGLAFTYYLSKLRPDLKIVVIDELDRTGGYIYSKPKANGINFFEKGPRTLRGLSNGSLLILDLLINLNQQDKILGLHNSNISNKKYILSQNESNHNGSIGTLIQLPDNLNTLFKFLIDPIGRNLPIGLINEFFQPVKKDLSKEETVEEFFDRRFNHDISINLVSPLIHGIYAGDISKLSINSIFPKLIKYEIEDKSIIRSIFKSFRKNNDQKNNKMDNYEIKDEILLKYKSIFKNSKLNFKKSKILLKNFPMISLKNGLQTLPNSIYNELINNSNIEFKLNTKISKLNNINENEIEIITKDNDNNEESIIVNHLRSTINSNKLSNLLSGGNNNDYENLSKYLNQLNYTSIILSNVFINKDVLSIHGFGVLVPKNLIKKLNLLGIIFDSEVEKNVKPIFKIKEISNELIYEEDEESKILPQYEGLIDINEINKLNKLSIKIEDQKIMKDKDYTKLTFMFGGSYLFNDPNFIKPSNSKLKQMIMNSLENELNINLNSLSLSTSTSSDDKNKKTDIIIENSEVLNCIPQYEIGYNKLKENVWEEVNKNNLNISFGGMSFADGVGVPDCVYNALKDAIKLSGK